MKLLEVKDLRTVFNTRKGSFYAADGISYVVEEGKTLGLVGESGSGKSVSSMSVLRLLDKNGRIESGEILFYDGDKVTDLAKLTEEEMRLVRGNKISVIFQEPMTALNPVFTIGRQLKEPFLIHRKMPKKEVEQEALKLLSLVRIPNPERVFSAYPHQLSGGMRQRVMIAMALACNPKLLIADEPTTALDVTIQAEILRLMKSLQKEQGMAIMFITHDLGVIREMADEVAVIYAGRVVEFCPAERIFQKDGMGHPYTEGLLASLPKNYKTAEAGMRRLETIPGSPPTPAEKITGCKFAPRCRYRTEKCTQAEPPMFLVDERQSVRCYYPDKEKRKHGNYADNADGQRP